MYSPAEALFLLKAILFILFMLLEREMALPMCSSTKGSPITPTQIRIGSPIFSLSHPLTLHLGLCAGGVTGLGHADLLDYEPSLATVAHRAKINYLGVFK